MPRAPFQVLVLLYSIRAPGAPLYAVLRRADMGVWQFVAGGGEEGETPEQAARREAGEEAGLPPDAPLHGLRSTGQVPVTAFRDRAHWPAGLATIPEHGFAAQADPGTVRPSAEHDAIEWLPYEQALARLEWESNRAALAELHARLVGRTAEE